MKLIVDGHLDLAFNVIADGRDLEHLNPFQIRDHEIKNPLNHDAGLCMTTLSELSKGGVCVAFATLFADPYQSWISPDKPNQNGYRTAEHAQSKALAQLAVYEAWEARGRVRMIKSQTDLTHHLELWRTDQKPGLVILMEGADPIQSPDDVSTWWNRGVRIVGTSWGPTRYAGGTGMPTGLTDIGRELVAALRDQKIILDASHQSWEAFWDSMDIGTHRVIASHSNTFALTPTSNRHLSNEMIHAIGQRAGVIGMVMYNRFLEPKWSREDRSERVLLDDQVRAHMNHVASLIGWDCVGIGSDIDGGFGCNETPEELETIADLQKIQKIVPASACDRVLGQNWLRFLGNALP